MSGSERGIAMKIASRIREQQHICSAEDMAGWYFRNCNVDEEYAFASIRKGAR